MHTAHITIDGANNTATAVSNPAALLRGSLSEQSKTREVMAVCHFEDQTQTRIAEQIARPKRTAACTATQVRTDVNSGSSGGGGGGCDGGQQWTRGARTKYVLHILPLHTHTHTRERK